MMQAAPVSAEKTIATQDTAQTATASRPKPRPAHAALRPSQTLGARVQTKLTVNRPGDAFEREADSMADHVMRMAAPSSVSASPMAIQRKCEECEKEDEEDIQGKEATAAGLVAPATGAVESILSRPGRPLDTEVRSFFEPRFGQDFGNVRVHTDGAAADSAKSINALAYTHSRNVVFGHGQYRPETETGRRLIAHELTHVVQQSGHAGANAPIQRACGPGTPEECPEYQAWLKTFPARPPDLKKPRVKTKSLLDWSRVGSAIIKKGEEGIGRGVDFIEDTERAATAYAANKVKDVPILGSVASAAKATVDGFTGLSGGSVRAVTGLVGGLATLAVNPVDTSHGLAEIVRRLPLFPYFDDDETIADDVEFWKKTAKGLVGQYSKQWKEGKYADVAAHAGVDVATLFLGVGLAGDAAKLAPIAEATDIAKVAPIAGAADVSDAAKIADVVDAAKIAPIAEATDVAKVAPIAGAADVSDAARIGEVADATRAAGAIDNSAHNASLYERLKAVLAEAEIRYAELAGSANKGGSGYVRSVAVTEQIPRYVNGKPLYINGELQTRAKVLDGVRTAQSAVDVPHSAAIFEQARIGESGRVFPFKDLTLTQLPSEVNGVQGVIEYLVDRSGKLTHQQFVEGGRISGSLGVPRPRPTIGSYYPEDFEALAREAEAALRVEAEAAKAARKAAKAAAKPTQNAARENTTIRAAEPAAAPAPARPGDVITAPISESVEAAKPVASTPSETVPAEPQATAELEATDIGELATPETGTKPANASTATSTRKGKNRRKPRREARRARTNVPPFDISDLSSVEQIIALIERRGGKDSKLYKYLLSENKQNIRGEIGEEIAARTLRKIYPNDLPLDELLRSSPSPRGVQPPSTVLESIDIARGKGVTEIDLLVLQQTENGLNISLVEQVKGFGASAGEADGQLTKTIDALKDPNTRFTHRGKDITPILRQANTDNTIKVARIPSDAAHAQYTNQAGLGKSGEVRVENLGINERDIQDIADFVLDNREQILKYFGPIP